MTNYWTRPNGTGISRRAALRASGAAGLGLAGAALIGCGDDDPAPTEPRAPGATPEDPEDDNLLRISPEEFREMPLDELLERIGPHHYQNLAGHRRAMQEGPKTGGTLRAFGNVPPHWDSLGSPPPWSIPAPYNSLIIFNFMADFGPHGETDAMVDLPESMEFADDLTFVFHMRDEPIYWHDVDPVNGREFTVEDAAIGVDALRDGLSTAQTYRDVESIETPDDKTLVLRFRQPAAYFLLSSTIPQLHLHAPEQIEAGTLGDWPIGTGPFILEEAQPDVRMTWRRNERYFKTDPLYGSDERLPFLDRIEYTFLPDRTTQAAAWAAGQVDYSVTGTSSRLDIVERLRERPDAVAGIVPPPASFQPYIALNLNTPPFNDERVRRAMSMAIDRHSMQEGIVGGLGTYGYAQDWTYFDRPENPWPWTMEELGPYYRFDVQEARQMLQAAGFDSGLGRPIRLDFSNSLEGLNASTWLAMADAWEQNLGIDIEIRNPADAATWISRMRSGEFEDMMAAFPNPSYDPDDFAYAPLHSQSHANHHHIDDPVIDELAEQQQVMLDVDERREILLDIMQRDLDQMYRLWGLQFYKVHLRDPAVYNFSDHYLAWMPGWGHRRVELTWVHR